MADKSVQTEMKTGSYKDWVRRQFLILLCCPFRNLSFNRGVRNQCHPGNRTGQCKQKHIFPSFRTNTFQVHTSNRCGRTPTPPVNTQHPTRTETQRENCKTNVFRDRIRAPNYRDRSINVAFLCKRGEKVSDCSPLWDVGRRMLHQMTQRSVTSDTSWVPK